MTYLETDVQITRDGHLVAFHDSNLRRTCGDSGDISGMTSTQLSKVRINGREPIPFLAEVFQSFPQAKINLDAKSDKVVDPLLEFLDRTGSWGRVCIGSFSHTRLQRVRAAAGELVCTSASPREVALWMGGSCPSGPSCIQVPIRQAFLAVVTSRRIRRSTSWGLPVHVWTVNDPLQMQRLIDLGVHGIMTDDCHVLRRVAQSNSMWTGPT